MAEKRKQADPRQDKTVSLHPLDPKAAVAAGQEEAASEETGHSHLKRRANRYK
jgi:hypothetical protein